MARRALTGNYLPVRDFLECIHVPYARDEWQYRFHEKKLDVINLPIYLRELVDIRSRGGSKTYDTMENPGLYLAHIGFKGIWFGAAKDQIEQPKKYLKWIIENSFLKYMIADGGLLKESVEFKHGGALKLKNLTEMNARSSRADYIIYDEEAQADKDAYNAAVNILAGSPLGLIIHISTPAKATVFEENYDRIKKREIINNEQLIFKRIWEDCSWLRSKSDWYAEQEKILPDWYFKQEHLAEFTSPMGAVFKNVVYDPYPQSLLDQISHQYLCSGVDWNPVSGHWIVGGKWTPDMRGFVIDEEHDIGQGYAVDMNMGQFQAIAQKGAMGNHLTMEEGGINEEYTKWFKKMLNETRFGWKDQNYHYEEWDSAGLNKLQTITYIIQNGITIYIDKMRFPTLAKMIEDCQWDPDSSEPKIKKDSSDSPHALDAFLHAVGKKNRSPSGIEIIRMW